MQTSHIQKCLNLISKHKPHSSSSSSSSSSSIPLLQPLNNHHHVDLKTLHAHFITSSLITNPFTASRLVQFCLQSPTNKSLTYATTIFHSLENPDVYTWNLMISSHAEFGLPNKSIAFYFKMRASNAPPNVYTFALVVKACIGNGGGGNVGLGRLVHGQVSKCGVEDLVVVKNSLLSMYCSFGILGDARVLFETSRYLDLISWNVMISACGKNGEVEIAQRMFDRMPTRSLVSWSALIDGYVRKGDFREALSLFDRLRSQGLEADEAILVSVLKSCAHLGVIYQGREIHKYIDNHFGLGRGGNVILQTALVDMYCKCGCIDEARQVFDRVQSRDVVMWNAMIGGLAMHGVPQKALQLFDTMKLQKHTVVVANGTTYLNVLCACKHGGLVDEGITIFESMKENGIEPLREHYGCLADLMGRAGRLREAEEVLLTMPMEPQASQWGGLLSACRMHKNVKVGERVGRKMIELEPLDGGRYVLLANLYAAVGEWEKAKEVRREMEERGAQKETGLSLA